MIIFQYKDKTHKCVSEWSEISLEKAVEVMEVAESFPDNLKKLYHLSADEKKADEYNKVDKLISDKQRFKEIPAIYGKIISLLSDVSDVDVNLWGPIERTAFYNDYIFKFVYGLIVSPFDYKAENIKDFEFRGETYYLPDSRMILGNEKPFADVTALEFAEVADLEINSRELTAGKYEVAANIVAILCRPEGEVYDEEKALIRAEKFKDLPMDIVWEVFFYTLSVSTLSRQRKLIYLMRDHLKELQRQSDLD